MDGHGGLLNWYASDSRAGGGLVHAYDVGGDLHEVPYALCHGLATCNSSYSAVIVGPMHHSVEGRGDASSAIQRMKDHPESYPPVIEARDSNGLKITNNSFREALKELDELFAA